MFNRGRDFATREFEQYAFALPNCEDVEPLLAATLQRILRAFAFADNAVPQFRMNIFVPQGSDLAIAYRCNMDEIALDTDRDLRFEYRSGLTGFCFVRRRPLVCNLEHLRQQFLDDPQTQDRLLGLNPEIHKLVRKDRTWLVSIPIFDPYDSYPVELTENREVGVGGQHFVELDSHLDGAVLGILNLDSAMSYGQIHLDEAPEKTGA